MKKGRKGGTYNRETLGNKGLECLITLCPFPFPWLGSSFFSGAGAAFFSSLGAAFSSFFFFSSFFSSFCSEDEELGADESSGPRFDGTSIEDKSSPSSARIAITWPTGILFAPSWTFSSVHLWGCRGRRKDVLGFYPSLHHLGLLRLLLLYLFPAYQLFFFFFFSRIDRSLFSRSDNHSVLRTSDIPWTSDKFPLLSLPDWR